MSPEQPPAPHSTALDHDIQVGRPLSFKKAAAPAAEAVKAPLKQKFAKAAKAKKFKRPRLDKSGNTPLLNAVLRDDLAGVRRRLKAGDDPNQCGRNSYGASPLHLVANGQSYAMAKALIDGGAQVESETLDTAINYTIGRFRDTPADERVDFLMIDAWKKQGGDVAELSSQLHNAAHAGDAALVEKLVACGADINFKREYSRPYSLEGGPMLPIECAIGGEGGLETVRAMLTLGANAEDARNYALNRRQPGDDAFEATPMGALLTAAAKHRTILTADEAKNAAREGLISDMLQNPPPGLKYSGRKIDRKAVEAHIKRYRR